MERPPLPNELELELDLGVEEKPEDCRLDVEGDDDCLFDAEGED
jgi:hypothetical protein